MKHANAVALYISKKLRQKKERNSVEGKITQEFGFQDQS